MSHTTHEAPDWENFAKAVLDDWPTGDLDGSVLFDLSLQYGMIKEVPGGYNSDHHIDAEGICPEEGDPWYEYTFRGEAGPGMYSIAEMNNRIEELEADNKRLRLEAAHANDTADVAIEWMKELEKERDHWIDVAGREGVCMSCSGPRGAPEPYGCTDCFNTGYCGERHNTVADLEAKLAKTVGALKKLADCVDDGCFCSEMEMATAMDAARATLT